MQIILPEMGEGVTEATVVSWLKKEGDEVREDEPLVEIETDKVTVEITAEVSGILRKIAVQPGETVQVGTPLAIIGDESSIQQSQRTSNGHDHAPPVITGSRSVQGIRVSPVVARIVKEHDIDITQVEGTGRDGRITKRDVMSYLEDAEQEEPARIEVQQPAPIPIQEPKVPTSEGELIPLTGIRRMIAEHMVVSKRTSPHVTTVFEIDFSTVAAHRAAHKEQFARDGVKLTYLPYIVQITAEAIKKHPIVNASWTDDGIQLKREINIGIATATERGLIVPVIRGADEKNLLGLARAIQDFADRARNNRLRPDETRSGTFTITNHGASGSLIGTPIINQPQVGILGVGLIEKRVKVIGDAIAIRPCAYISFSFDHRILDGATADAFVMDIKQTVENFS